MTNNLNFGNPLKPESFYMLSEAVRGLKEACEAFDLPVVGGNVSLYNESPDSAIDPSPVVSLVGMIDRPNDITSQFLKTGNEVLILLGNLPNELGASFFLEVIHHLKTGNAPSINLETEAKLHSFLHLQIQKGRVAAAHDISDGGLLVALSEMLFARETTFGANIDLTGFTMPRLDCALFGESQSRVLVAAEPTKADKILSDAEKFGIDADLIGEASQEAVLRLTAPGIAQELVWDTPELRRVWQEAIPSVMSTKDHPME